jgi:16S rRNA (cytosine1402-N4)-methyltransferase
LAILLDMPSTHVPVLAGELIEALDPQPGPGRGRLHLGGGGHARLVADRLGPTGCSSASTATRSPRRRFAELAAEVACRTRFVRADFATGLRRCSTRACGRPRLPRPRDVSMQVDTRERGFSYAYDAPLDMRMDPRAAADRS